MATNHCSLLPRNQRSVYTTYDLRRILANDRLGLELEDVDRLFKKDDGVVDALYEEKAQQEQVESKRSDVV